jgi:multicomponent Na+:H+ antiporter subunit A
MAAPTPVSAYLHSATMVKAGVYLMARMNPARRHGAVVLDAGHRGRLHHRLREPAGVRQTDIKQVLAYTTLMALGALTLFIGAGTRTRSRRR